MRPLTSEVTFTWCTAASSPTATSRFGITSALASATLTVTGGGLLLAKNCAIIWLRKWLNQTRPPTKSASRVPMMMNHSTGRAGRVRGFFSSIGFPEIFGSVTMFMSCTFCNHWRSHVLTRFVVQMGGDCGFVKSDSAEQKLAKLPFECAGVAIGEAWRGRKLRQRRHQRGVMGEPEQVERIACNPRRIA